jgi:hypothetical protein
MDRGVPTEAVLEEMRRSEPPVQYLVGTPKGRLNRLEQSLLIKPWREARPGVKVKLLPEDGELYVYAESQDRIAKERSMRRRQLKWLWARLAELRACSARCAADGSAAPRVRRRARGACSTWGRNSPAFTYQPRQAACAGAARGAISCAPI